jgi:hypothetical protein
VLYRALGLFGVRTFPADPSPPAAALPPEQQHPSPGWQSAPYETYAAYEDDGLGGGVVTSAEETIWQSLALQLSPPTGPTALMKILMTCRGRSTGGRSTTHRAWSALISQWYYLPTLVSSLPRHRDQGYFPDLDILQTIFHSRIQAL